MRTTIKDPDGTSWVNWEVFPATWTDKEIKAFLMQKGWDPGHHYSGPGEVFNDRLVIRRGPFRVLAYQRGWLDV